MVATLSRNTQNPQQVYDFLYMRDQDGEQIFTHVIDTKQFDLLEVKSISNAVLMLWRGSVNAKSIFMQNSTAYQALF